MRTLNVLGVAAGAVSTALGLYFAPSPTSDPAAGGLCATGLGGIFPIHAPEIRPPQYDLDMATCLLEPVGVALLLLYLAAVFLIAGAFASRLGEQDDPRRGALAVGLVVVVHLLEMSLRGESVDRVPTCLAALATVAGAVGLAYAGGRLAQRGRGLAA